MLYEYKGFEISCSDYDDACKVENFHTGLSMDFETFDAACDWIDEQMEDEEDFEEDPDLHTYLFFFVDSDTDRSEQAYIKAKNYNEAVKILYKQYDVYHIADYTVLD